MSTASKLRPKAKVPQGAQELMGRAEIASALKVCERTLDTLVAKGGFPKADFRIGDLPRWRVATYNQWVEDQSRGGGIQTRNG